MGSITSLLLALKVQQEPICLGDQALGDCEPRVLLQRFLEVVEKLLHGFLAAAIGVGPKLQL